LNGLMLLDLPLRQVPASVAVNKEDIVVGVVDQTPGSSDHGELFLQVFQELMLLWMKQVHIQHFPFVNILDNSFQFYFFYWKRSKFIAHILLCGKNYWNIIYKNFIHLQYDFR